MRTCISLACAAAAGIVSNAAQAHHGLDFLLVQTAHLPDQGTGYAFARVDHLSESVDETGFEPGALFGATDWMTVELHGHYHKEESESSRFESIAPALNFRLTPRGRLFSFGLSAEYEFTDASDDADVAEVAALFGYEANAWVVAGNVLYEKASGASGEWGYAAGVRRTFAEKHAIGVETLGSFESDGSSEMMVGYYGEFSERFTFNAGIGTGLHKGPDRSARMAMIWRFK
jgi:hypothetical protein